MESLFGQGLFTRPEAKEGDSEGPDKPESVNVGLVPDLSADVPAAPAAPAAFACADLAAEAVDPQRVIRSLKRRAPDIISQQHTFFKPVNAIETKKPGPMRPRKRNRPLLTDMFRPHKDGDLVLYEQHARHVRSFFAEWSRYVDGEGKLPRRLLIVSGPPGCGKTCSVQVLGRKFGFRLLELETGPSFSRDLMNATCTARESTGEIPGQYLEGEYTRHGRRPYFTNSKGDVVWDSRPACVYLDCDGLSGVDASRFARDVTNAAWKAKRPMVLVVNNRFSPAAIDLRQKHFTTEAVFRRPAANELRRGILRCADSHNIDIPRAAIDRVLEVCQGDIRASLTALQFSFVNSAAREQGTTTAMSLFNDKKPLADLDLFMDLELVKLYERVFDYSLDTDVCWDMDKIKAIGEWNALADAMRQSGDSDLYLRACLLKYRELFKTGKLLEYKQAHNDFETMQRVREVVEQVQTLSSIEMYRGYSKVAVLLELLPLVGTMGDLGRSPKQASLEQLALILHALGVRSVGKIEGRVVAKPDIGVLCGRSLPSELVAVFEAMFNSEDTRPVTTRASQRPAAPAKRLDHKNWLKPTDTQIQAARKLQPGVWLDFKVSDENQAKRGIGLRDLFV